MTSMKIAVAYPPIDSPKGTALLSQNRQFQYFHAPTYIYPMVPAYAATHLKSKGYDVLWLDGIAERWSMEQFLEILEKERPDLLLMETKTPVIKKHWQQIKQFKARWPEMKVVMVGDHVTWNPQETLQAAPVDFILTGGDYDFAVVNLVRALQGREDLGPGVWWRDGDQIKHSGPLRLRANRLDDLPMIDRDLTRWHLYAYHNGNYKYFPGTYLYSGRDCFVAGTLIETQEGQIPVERIRVGHLVRTHTGRYHRVFEARSRRVLRTLLIETYGNGPVRCTPEHPFWTKRGWVEARHLEPSDWIGFPIPEEGPDAETLYGLPTDEDSMWFYGWYLANGRITKRNEISIALRTQEDRKQISDCLVRMGWFKSPSASMRPHRNIRRMVIRCGSILVKGFKTLFGSDSLDKKIHPSVQRLPTKKLRALLDGYFAGMNIRLQDRSTPFSALVVSKVLTIDLRNLLLKLGVIASVCPNDSIRQTQESGSVPRWAGALCFTIGPAWSEVLSDFIPKMDAFIEGGYAWYRVRSVREAGPAVVYNFSVEADQSYIADGLAVHNCWWNRCTFCVWDHTLYPKGTFRAHSPQRVLDEVGMLIERYGVREIFDDCGTFPIGGWLKTFCQGMIERGYNRKVRFGCNMRVNALGQAEYDLMAKAGFRFILYGIESANQKTLDMLDKGCKVEEIEQGLRMAKRAGLEPHITVMMGYPWETLEDARRTVELAKRLFRKGYVDTLQGTIVVPYPGTPLFQMCKERGWLKTEDWDRYDMRESVMICPTSDEEIRALTQDLYKAFLSPAFVVRKLLSIRSLDDVRFYAIAAKKFVGHLLDFHPKQPTANGEVNVHLRQHETLSAV